MLQKILSFSLLFIFPLYAEAQILPKSTASFVRGLDNSKIELAVKRAIRRPNIALNRMKHAPLYRNLRFPSTQEIEQKWHKIDPGIIPLYNQKVASFLAVKRDLDIFFEYYRFEPQFIDPNTKRDKEVLMTQATADLRDISLLLPQEEPSVRAAHLYLKEAFEALHPTYALTNTTAPDTYTRKLVPSEFLLWEPGDTQSPLMKIIAAGNTLNADALQKAAQLPARSIAFINDDPETCQWVLKWSAQGYFGKGSRVAIFDSLDSFLQRIDGNVTYDVVLLDWVLNDGFSLAAVQRLRTSSNPNTIIFLNSVLFDDQVKVEEMYARGFDGFISSIGFREDTGGARIARALYTYEYYKKLHGWQH